MDENERQELRAIADYYIESSPFGKLLGIDKNSVDLDNDTITVTMRNDLIGNAFQGILHGGAISGMLDSMGGHLMFITGLKKLAGLPRKERIKKAPLVSTIDLRIDYLRPGRGKVFTTTGSILRQGNKVAVTRMELHNEKGELIAVGTGTYLVSPMPSTTSFDKITSTDKL